MSRALGASMFGSMVAGLTAMVVGALVRTVVSLRAGRARGVAAVSVGAIVRLILATVAIMVAGLLHRLSGRVVPAGDAGLLACRPTLLGVAGGCGAC